MLGIDNTPKAFSEYMKSSYRRFADTVGANVAEKYSKSEVLEHLQKYKIVIPLEQKNDIACLYPNIIAFKKAFNFTDSEMSSMISIPSMFDNKFYRAVF